MPVIPVFLFLGFLDSGKTQYIQDSLCEDENLATGERTLLLVCEEGEVEYDAHMLASKNIVQKQIEDEEDFNPGTLEKLACEAGAKRVIIEYNGMWATDRLYAAIGGAGMPLPWQLVQSMTFFDAATFLSYNQNMRQLVYDKLTVPPFGGATVPQMIVFNRFKGEFDKNDFHKIVRGANRRTEIVYEYTGGAFEFDDIEDPLPYDMNSPVIEIKDEDYAVFYRDLMENTAAYNHRTVKFKGLAAVSRKLPAGEMAFGRLVMACCAEDIQYAAIAMKTQGKITDVKTQDWFVVTARISDEYNKVYRENGPVLYVEKIERCAPLPPETAVAVFY